VGFLIDGHLGQDHLILDSPYARPVAGPSFPFLHDGSVSTFSINGNDSCDLFRHSTHPVQETLLKLVGIESRKHTASVSCDGTLFGRCKKVFSQASFVLPKDSMSSHPSAPQRTSTIAMRMIYSNWCRLVLSIPGSSMPLKMLCRVVVLSSSVFQLRYHAVLVCILLPLPKCRCNCSG
jgi:hypothetical protein